MAHLAERNIPSNLTDTLSFPEMKVVIYLYTDSEGRPCSKGYSGRRTKPDFSYYHLSEADRTKSVDRCMKSERGKLEYREAQAAKDKRAVKIGHGIEVGDIYYSSWGYEQTNVSFYQVVRLAGKSVEFQKLESTTVEQTSDMSGKVMPVKDSFKGNPFLKLPRVNSHGVSIRVDSSEHLRKWDGTPKFTSSWA